MDADSPGQPTGSPVQELRQRFPHTEVLVLSACDNPTQLIRIVLEDGVSGWLQKPCPAEQIMRSIRLFSEGGACSSSEAALTILRYFRARGQSVHSLSKAGAEVLDCVAVGLSADAIAGRLAVTKGTMQPPAPDSA